MCVDVTFETILSGCIYDYTIMCGYSVVHPQIHDTTNKQLSQVFIFCDKSATSLSLVLGLIVLNTFFSTSGVQ